MIDLKQVLQALTLATNRSLVVLDEFGKGTLLAGMPLRICRSSALVVNAIQHLHTDGIGLLCATINHWARRGTAGCPMLMVATHFHELFHNNLLDADVAPLISYQTMEVLWNADDSLTFLYRYVLYKVADLHEL